MKKVIFTVTNDLNYDQRMNRICNSMVDAGYDVMLVGCRKRDTPPLEEKRYRQKRLFCPWSRGFFFYAAYNFSLFFYLLFKKAHIICSIDLDTILPVWLASGLKGTKRVYDAHEYFSQQKEVLTRPGVYRVWHWIEQKMIPRFRNGYTVSRSIAEEFRKLYGVHYEVVRNMPLLKPGISAAEKTSPVILYQGAVNEARGLEFLIPAMKAVDATLLIYGDGNFVEHTKDLIKANNLPAKVLLKGKVLPRELDTITAKARIGINLVENTGLNQYYSLANKFFDYMQHGIPQLSMNFPEYRMINEEFEVAVLIDDLDATTIATALNTLLNDKVLYDRLQQNCLKAREALNWQAEEKKLLEFYEKVIHSTWTKNH